MCSFIRLFHWHLPGNRLSLPLFPTYLVLFLLLCICPDVSGYAGTVYDGTAIKGKLDRSGRGRNLYLFLYYRRTDREDRDRFKSDPYWRILWLDDLCRSSGFKQKKRSQEFQKTTQKMKVVKRGHKCAVCGRTDKDSPGMEFRYCSKCEGNYEYCMDHLYTHKHVKKEDADNSNSND